MSMEAALITMHSIRLNLKIKTNKEIKNGNKQIHRQLFIKNITAIKRTLYTNYLI